MGRRCYLDSTGKPFGGEKNADGHLVNHINKSMGITSNEVFEFLGFVPVGENAVYHFDSLVCGEGGLNQPIPDRGFTRSEHTVRLTNG